MFKNCQAEKSNMLPVKPQMNMQSNGPAMLIQHKMSKKQIMPQEDDKNCQSTKYYESKCVLTRNVKEILICGQ